MIELFEAYGNLAIIIMVVYLFKQHWSLYKKVRNIEKTYVKKPEK